MKTILAIYPSKLETKRVLQMLRREAIILEGEETGFGSATNVNVQWGSDGCKFSFTMGGLDISGSVEVIEGTVTIMVTVPTWVAWLLGKKIKSEIVAGLKEILEPERNHA